VFDPSRRRAGSASERWTRAIGTERVARRGSVARRPSVPSRRSIGSATPIGSRKSTWVGRFLCGSGGHGPCLRRGPSTREKEAVRALDRLRLEFHLSPELLDSLGGLRGGRCRRQSARRGEDLLSHRKALRSRGYRCPRDTVRQPDHRRMPRTRPPGPPRRLKGIAAQALWRRGHDHGGHGSRGYGVVPQAGTIPAAHRLEAGVRGVVRVETRRSRWRLAVRALARSLVASGVPA
jgi:hypothetical protein